MTATAARMRRRAAPIPIDSAGDEIARLRALVDEERRRARSYAMQSDTESAKEAEARAGELEQRIAELER